MAEEIRTNEEWLLKMPVEVQPVHPGRRRSYGVAHDGTPYALPSVGGITYNLRIGDPALGWSGDHIEPCVSAKNPDEGKNAGANFLACVGNVAKVKIGERVRRGFVTGHHGGCEHIMIDFPADVLPELTYSDTIRIETFGQGLELLGLGDIKVMNLDPRLLRHPNWAIAAKGKGLTVPVAKLLPAKIMGAGLGADDCHSGDYDIQLFDEATNAEYGLDDLRLGDIVAIIDADHTYGRIFRTGAVSVGVVVHGACLSSGHGPGVVTLLTSASGAIEPIVDSAANLATILGAGVEPEE